MSFKNLGSLAHATSKAEITGQDLYEQCQQVYRARKHHGRCWSATAVRPRLDHAGSDGHRHRYDARAERQAVPGVFAGFLGHGEQIRWHWAWTRHQPAVLPDDGWRHHSRERARSRIDL